MGVGEIAVDTEWAYQSIDWGGSSFEGEVLTVSTQPRIHVLALPVVCIRNLGKLQRDVPGIGSFPCRFKNAEYATMNFCAYNHENDTLANWTIFDPLSALNCNAKASVETLLGLLVPPLCVCLRHTAGKVWELTSTSRTLTPPVIMAALTSLGEEGGKVVACRKFFSLLQCVDL